MQNRRHRVNCGQEERVCLGRKERTMYGTIARFQLKPGMAAKLDALQQQFTAAAVPGFIAAYVYQMAADASEHYLVVVFASQAAYQANASSPAQAARYEAL